MIIAIDGPAASGKGTLAKRLAAHFGFHHLDTGLLYRGTAFALVDAGKSLDNETLASEAASSLNLDQLDETILSAHEVGEAASKVAAMPAVRTALFAAQQDFSKREPGAVLDGRDIGTVICPDADVKLYVTATPEVRAMRRYQQAQMRGSEITYMEVLEDIRKRDERDAGRDNAPLKIADDASLIDTSEMSIEAAFGHALQIAEERIGK